jgi:hypothetical protein
METRNFRRMLLTALFSTAAFGVTVSAALADDGNTIYGRSSESGALGVRINAMAAEDVSKAYDRAPQTEPAVDDARYHLTFKLMQGAHRDNLPAVDAWPGRAAAPLEENAAWKITMQSLNKSGSPHG